MRKLGIAVTTLLLISVLVLMLISAGLFPFQVSSNEQIKPTTVAAKFSNNLQNNTEHVLETRPQLKAITPHGHIIVQGGPVERVEIAVLAESKATTPRRAQELLDQISVEIITNEEKNIFVVHTPSTQTNEMVKADLTILVPLEGNLDLETGLGQVEINAIHGDLKVLTRLGAIKVQDFRGNAYLETSLGNIEVSSSQFKKELAALSHLGDLHIEANLAQNNVLESSLGDLTLLLSPEESYVLDGKLSLGKFLIQVPFKGQQSKEQLQGIIGEGPQRGSIFVTLSLGSLELKNN